MRGVLQPSLRSIAVGTAIYVVFYLLINIYMNAIASDYPRNVVAKGLIGFLTYFPFLAAGYNTALRSHPAGVFNSIVVGIIAGFVTIQYASFYSGSTFPTYTNATEFAGSIAAGLIVCSLGGVFGEVKHHYMSDAAPID